ncbi:MAG: methyltransferase domain-containing protein [Nitrospira sp.]|nr:methyltransferase domain-containing protein [Nitrospira sp.]
MKATIKRILNPIYLFYTYATSRKKISNFLNRENEIFLELGAGDKKGSSGWITIDMTKKCDIFWDLSKGIPFPNESVSKIYSSHFFEHLTFREGQIFLDECLRVLIPGGTFSICVPNARIYIEAYLNSKLDTDKFLGYKPAYNHTTKIDYVNYTAYMDGHHKYMFDEENLVYILKATGMKNVHLREFDPLLDLKVRDFESIYAIAEK